MGYLTSVGLPVPFGNEGNNVPHDLLAFAQRLDDIFSARTYTEISAFAGTDVWDGRIVFQSDTGPLRLAPGLYRYSGAAATWVSLAMTVGTPASYDPSWTQATSNPSRGNTLSEGRYQRFGTLCFADFTAIIGSTFVSGSGAVQFPLPVPAATAALTAPILFGIAWTYDVSVVQNRLVQLESAGSTSFVQGHVTRSVPPITGPDQGTSFAVGDVVTGMMLYECAEN